MDAAAKRPNAFEIPALSLVVATTIVTLMGIPSESWRGSFFDPCHVATVSAIAVVLTLLVTRTLGERGVRVERWILAMFLAGMPLVYVSSWIWTQASGVDWLWLELAGVPAYAALAVLGLRRSPWLLAFGIAAHGALWDSWHFGRTSFIPNWYVLGCLAMDVTIALYIAARIGRWSPESGARAVAA